VNIPKESASLSTFTIALLVDAENISHAYLATIYNQAVALGKIRIFAVYGNFQNVALAKWLELCKKYKLHVRDQSKTKKQNSTDTKLMLEAMDIRYQIPEVDTFCLVTNDADFVPLCTQLQEAGKRVIVLGTSHASTELIHASDIFISMSASKRKMPAPKPAPTPAPKLETAPASMPETTLETAPAPTPEALSDLKEKIIQTFAECPKDKDGWATLSQFGTTLRNKFGTFSVTNYYGDVRLSRLLERFPDFVEVKTLDTTRYVKVITQPSAHKKTAAPLPSSSPQNADPQQQRKALEALIRKAFEEASFSQGGWLTLSALGSTLLKLDTDFSPSRYGSSQLSKLLQTMPDFVQLKETSKGTMSAKLK
jgi:uncharacterized protein (TIGR00288 family)